MLPAQTVDGMVETRVCMHALVKAIDHGRRRKGGVIAVRGAVGNVPGNVLGRGAGGIDEALGAPIALDPHFAQARSGFRPGFEDRQAFAADDTGDVQRLAKRHGVVIRGYQASCQQFLVQVGAVLAGARNGTFARRVRKAQTRQERCCGDRGLWDSGRSGYDRAWNRGGRKGRAGRQMPLEIRSHTSLRGEKV